MISISAVSAVDESSNDIISNSNGEIIFEDNINEDVLTTINDNEIGESISFDEMNPQDSSINSGNTFTDIQEGINSNEDGLIELNNNFTYDEGIDGDFSNGITVNKNLTIDGKGHTIDANSNGNNVRIFNIRNSEVVIKNTIFKNAYVEENGAAILITNSKVTIQNCTFLNNYAKNYGGAIRFYGPNGNVINCTFENNNATHGGAIYWSNGPNGTLKDSIFVDNHGSRGGAVYWFSADGTIDNCTFENNTANGNHGGGAVYWYGNNGSIIDSTFVNNKAYENYASGGAVYWYYGNNGLIHNSSFINNSAEYGGSVRWDTNNGRIKYSNFTDNYGNYKAGAILWNGVNGTVFGSIFYNNSAKTEAGSILLNNSENITIYNSTFNNTKNVASVLFENCINIFISDSIFEENSLAIYWTGIGGKIEDSIFRNNNQSSYLIADNLIFDNCNICNNNNTFDITGNNIHINRIISTNNKNHIRLVGNDTIIENSNFTSNNRALYILGNNISFYNSIFSSNFITKNDSMDSDGGNAFNGGAIKLYGNDNLFENCNFTNNYAKNLVFDSSYVSLRGGAIFISGENNSFSSCNFDNNSIQSDFYQKNCPKPDSIKNYGGAIYIDGKSMINNCNFSNNFIKSIANTTFGSTLFMITSYGGAIYSSSSNSSLINSNFLGNYIDDILTPNVTYYSFSAVYLYSGGGAIYYTGVNSNFSNLEFINNDASAVVNPVQKNNINSYIYGGAVHIGGSNMEISNSKFLNNTFLGSGIITKMYKGALSLFGPGEVFNSTFSNNVGHHISSTSEILVNESNFNGSQSAIYNFGNISIVLNSNFTNCYSSLYNPTTVNNCNFLNNTNSTIITYINTTISNSKFVNTRHNESIFSNYSTQISKSTFINNPGAIFFNGTGSVNTSSFINNTKTAIYYNQSAANVSNCIFINNKGTEYNDIYSNNYSRANFNYWGSNNGPDGQALSPSVTYDNYVLFNIESPGDYVLWEDNVSIYGGLIQYTDGTNIYNMAEDMPPLTIKLLVDIGEVDSLVIDSPDAKVNASYFAANVGYETFSVKLFDITETTIFEVINKKASKLIANNMSVICSGDNIFEVRFSDNKNSSYENREIKLYIDDILFDIKATSSDSIAYFNISNLTYGNHSVYVEFVEDESFIQSNLSNLWIFVEKSDVNVYLEDIIITIGQNATLSAYVTDYMNNPVNGGLVRFYINGADIGYSNVINGFANLIYSDCPYGNYTIFASFEENGYYHNNSSTANLVVNKLNTILEIECDDFDYNNPSTIKVTLSNEDGSKLSDKEIKLNISNGVVSKSFNLTTNSQGFVYLIENFDSGLWNISAIFEGDGSYYDSQSNDNFVVNKLNTSLSFSEIPNITLGETFTININVLSKDIVNEGILEFYIDSVKIGVSNVTNGMASLSHILNVSKSYSLLVFYINGTNFENSQAVTTLEVNKINSSVNASNVTSYCGDISFIDVNVLDQYGKKINSEFINVYYENGTSELISLINNKLSIDTSNWASGTYNLALEYLGDDFYSSSKTNSTLVINKRDTFIHVENYSKNIGDSFNIQISVNSSNIVNEGSISLFINNQMVTLDVIDGVVSYEYLCNNLGNFTYEVSYSGGNSYNPSGNIFYIYVEDLKSTSISVSNVVVSDDSVDMDVKVNTSDSIVNVNNVTIVYQNGSREIIPVTDGKISISRENLNAGNYSIDIVYLGDNEYAGSNVTVNFTILKKNVIISAPDYIIKLNGLLNYNIKLLDENNNLLKINTTVFINLNNKDYPVPIVDGEGSILLNDFGNSGNLTANIDFSGNENYFNSRNTSNIEVLPLNTSLKISIEDSYVDNNVSLDIILVDENGLPLTGSIVLNFNNENYTLDVTDGKLTYYLNYLNSGTYFVSATYNGNGNYAHSSDSVYFNICKYNSNLIYSINNGTYNEDIFLNLGLMGQNNELLSGFVTIIIDNKSTEYHIDKFTTINLGSFDAGIHFINILFNGSERYTGSNTTVQVTVKKAETNLTAPTVTATYNVNKYLVITLKDARGNILVNKKVSVKVESISKTLTTNSKGQVSVLVSGLVPKTYYASINFAEDSNYVKSSASAKVVVKKATPKLTAKAKTFKVKVKTKKYTITLKNNKGKVMKNTKVTLKVKGKTYKAKTNSKGVATFKITNLKKKGKFRAVVKYAGSKYYNKVTKKLRITIKA